MKKVCCICGREITNSLYFHADMSTFICNNDNCFHQYFWNDAENKFLNDKCNEYAIINYEMYRIGSETDSPKGCGGRHYTIQFHNGTTRETTSLWHIGKVPKDRRATLKNNADFLKKG